MITTIKIQTALLQKLVSFKIKSIMALRSARVTAINAGSVFRLKTRTMLNAVKSALPLGFNSNKAQVTRYSNHSFNTNDVAAQNFNANGPVILKINANQFKRKGFVAQGYNGGRAVMRFSPKSILVIGGIAITGILVAGIAVAGISVTFASWLSKFTLLSQSYLAM